MTTRVVLETPPTGSEAPPAATADQPIPDKFKNEDGTVNTVALGKSYAELEAELTRVKQGKATETPSTETPNDGSTPDEKPDGEGAEKKPDEKKPDEEKPDDAANKVVEAAGLDVAPFQQEFETTGDVTPESRDKIAKGLEKILGPQSREAVDQFIEGRKLAVANERKMYMDAAGGEDNYNTITVWAKDNLSKEYIAAYDKTVSSGDPHATMLAIEALKAKFEGANGKAPTLLRGRGNQQLGGSRPFSSTAEMTRAMSDPKYKTDQAYRDEVAARIAAG